jgi:hypothetical protein
LANAIKVMPEIATAAVFLIIWEGVLSFNGGDA